MKRFKYLIAFLVLGSCMGCSNNTNQEMIDAYSSKIRAAFPGQVTFEDPNWQLVNRSSIETDDEFSIMVLINTGCSSCYEEMEKWQQAVDEKTFKGSPKLIMVAEGESSGYFNNALAQNHYEFDIMLDTSYTFSVKNNLVSYPRSTFLLNSNHEIIALGSPLEDAEAMKLYNLLISKP